MKNIEAKLFEELNETIPNHIILGKRKIKTTLLMWDKIKNLSELAEYIEKRTEKTRTSKVIYTELFNARKLNTGIPLWMAYLTWEYTNNIAKQFGTTINMQDMIGFSVQLEPEG